MWHTSNNVHVCTFTKQQKTFQYYFHEANKQHNSGSNYQHVSRAKEQTRNYLKNAAKQKQNQTETGLVAIETEQGKTFIHARQAQRYLGRHTSKHIHAQTHTRTHIQEGTDWARVISDRRQPEKLRTSHGWRWALPAAVAKPRRLIADFQMLAPAGRSPEPIKFSTQPLTGKAAKADEPNYLRKHPTNCLTKL